MPGTKVTRICNRCKESKGADSFYKNAQSPNGYETTCKACRWERQKERIASDPDAKAASLATKRRYNRKHSQRNKQRKVDAYIAEFGHPECACGCGELVTFTDGGKPREFRSGHRRRVDAELNARIMATGSNEIPIELFREHLRRIRSDRGVTLKQLSKDVGLSMDHMTSIMHDSRKKHIRRSLAEHILKRLAGIPTIPTSYEMRMDKLAAKEKDFF